MKHLALLGGTPVFQKAPPEELTKWPILTEEDDRAVLEVLHNNSFSGTDITEKLQAEFAEWLGVHYALAFCNGTASLLAAMFAIGLGAGDEILCPTKTYWASISPAVNLGAIPVFININEMLSMDPNDIERAITSRTKAIMVVHYMAYPCDMDPIMAIARKHNLKVIEDVSHAQGGLYKGRRLGTFGDVAAMSLMSGKSFAAGELGMLVTNDKRCYERALAFGHYDRNNGAHITESDELKPFFHIALGGFKGRANQLCAALARNQLKYYDARCAEIRKSMNLFWDLLEGQPGIRAVRVDESTGSNMAGWYIPHGCYHPEELDGLSVERFVQAVNAELVYTRSSSGANYCLHTHPFFRDFDLLRLGKPSRVSFTDRDARLDDEKCKPSENIYCFSAPWIKRYDEEWIALYAEAFKKVIRRHAELLEDENANKESQRGRWYGTENK